MARGDRSASSLAPGFRFHPTDEELVRYYLKRKITNKPFKFDAIAVVDVYKTEPWDLPGKSKLKTRDLEWYFFSMLDKKYSNGSKTNRATEKGYWKTTGKDRPVRWNSRDVGMKKTLVYHLGRAPRGERSNWVMHEYRLVDVDLEKAGVVQDAFVLCRIFQKSGTGPKNGEQYGAPFVEEEWDNDDEVVLLPGEEMVVSDDLALGDGAYVEANEVDQNFNAAAVSENAVLPVNYYHGETCNEQFGNFNADEQKPIVEQEDAQNGSDRPEEKVFFSFPEDYQIDAKPVRKEFRAESSNNIDATDDNYLLDEPFLDATDSPPFNEGFYLEANDLSNPLERDCTGDSTVFDMVDEYLNFFDASDDNLTFDPSELLGSENVVSNEAVSSETDVNGGVKELPIANQELPETHNSTNTSSSNQQKPEPAKFESDFKYPFMKQASQMLGSISAPPAFASEFPLKGSAMHLNAASSSSSIRVTAGMIRVENVTFGNNGLDWSFDKSGNVSIVLSFDVSQGDGNLAPMGNPFSSKTWSMVSRCWFFLMFFWVLILSASFKIGTYISTK
ncbi:NAC domain-containing protein 78-like isoform X2 [Mercurialis annua]|uniref:NAC domain-containing protein 78-like isoform X2 n=1 Tax=Mercurialis annua TaxID=3986 RepID=UPI00215F8F7A|nr:NAC domain-containing protein 78-like isoform X2 [Mercurialis annua]